MNTGITWFQSSNDYQLHWLLYNQTGIVEDAKSQVLFDAGIKVPYTVNDKLKFETGMHYILNPGRYKSFLQELTGRWEKLSTELHNLSPLNILKMGYALCWKGNGRALVRRIEDVEARENLIVSFYKGEFRCEVKKVDREKRIESSLIKEKK